MVVPQEVYSAVIQGNLAVVREYFASMMFLRDLRAAGGTAKGFLWAPRADLCMLRLLCEQGRAIPLCGPLPDHPQSYGTHPCVVDEEDRTFLERLFAWAPPYSTDSRRRTRSAKAAVRASQNPVPRDVFKLVISFWKPRSEVWWQGDAYRRYDHFMTNRTYSDPRTYVPGQAHSR